jgi:sigma-B regulation protein RsbU (phosphoserine phosphatase)
MESAPHVLLLDAASGRTESVRNRLWERGLPTRCLDLAHTPTAAGDLKTADIVLVSVDQTALNEHQHRLDELLARLSASGVPALVWGLPDNHSRANGAPVECLSASVSLDEIVGRVTTMARYAPLVKRLDRELEHMQRVGQQLQRYFSGIDKEMRLAGRLQCNFLPRSLPQLVRLRSACLYRPASWVSGDVYDVYEIDRRHIGIFIADAMGHGTAAALMTMFLRQALLANHVVGQDRRLVDPPVVMERLNQSLVGLELTDFQFVTAAYAIVDTESGELRLARGGHPFALHIRGDDIRELRPVGDLLGLPELRAEFGEEHVRLEPGDKVILYTDGAEENLVLSRRPGKVEFHPHLHVWAKLGAEAFVETLARFLDRQVGSLHPPDDITVIALEIPL